MGHDLSRLKRQSVILRDDQMGVATESKPRKVQLRNDQDTYTVTLNADWLSQLGMDEQSEPTVHSMSIGMHPVIVQNPAIIIQPMTVLEDDDE